MVGPVSLTWVHRICWIRTILEIHDHVLYIKAFTHADMLLSITKQIWPCHKNGHLALFSLRTESDNPDATCELSP